jgi:outer membrane protein assembly factor BamB
MNLTSICTSGARSWIFAGVLALVLMPLGGRGADWQMNGSDLTNDRNQPQETVSRTTPVLADGVLVAALQPQSFGAKHESFYLLGLNPKTGDFLWKAMLDKHPATMLRQPPVVYNGVVYIGASSDEEHWATDTKYECCSFVASMAAVDLKTGKVIWQTPMVPKGYTGSAIWSSDGYMRALDAVTGKTLWSFASGGSVASGPAIAHGMVFWGSGYEHLNSPTVHQSVGNDMFYAFTPAVLPRTSRLDVRK